MRMTATAMVFVVVVFVVVASRSHYLYFPSTVVRPDGGFV